ncbi:MAG: hypothetical protein ACREL5_14915 [Gemmatimonadales bacterium]
MLVVLDSLDGTLRIIPVDSPDVVHTVPLNTAGTPTSALALRGQYAAVAIGGSVEIIDLGAPSHVVCGPNQLSGHGPVTALTFADNGQGYAAQPTGDAVSRFDPAQQCGGSRDSIVGGPQNFGSARGRVFVLVGNRNRPPFTGDPAADTVLAHDCLPPTPACPEQPSWLITLDDHRDSVPLGFPGNASAAVLASDGSLYVINAGNGGSDGTLVQVAPVQLSLQASFGGFGRSPKYLATDGADRIFVASPLDGLMVFNIRTRQVEKGAGAGPPLTQPRGMVTDDFGRIYVAQLGNCATNGDNGVVRIFDSSLSEHGRGITVGRCPIAIGVTDIPTALYRFAN